MGLPSWRFLDLPLTTGFEEDSDVDFLVDFSPGRPDPFEDFCALRDELREIVNRDVDLVVKRAIRNPYFRESALSQSETVYVADVQGLSLGTPTTHVRPSGQQLRRQGQNDIAGRMHARRSSDAVEVPGQDCKADAQDEQGDRHAMGHPGGAHPDADGLR